MGESDVEVGGPVGRSGNVLGVVLAAGAGTRYGMPKILAHQGEWLTIAVSALRDGGCPEVMVAMGAAVVSAPAGASAIVVPDWSDGMGSTVAAVLRAARNESGLAGVLLHVVDTPDVGADVVARVLSAAEGHRSVLARAVFDGRPGHPVYIGIDHIDGVLAVVGGEVGARAYLRDRADVVDVECGDLATGADVDVE